MELQLGQKMVVASHNPGKVRELQAILQPLHVEIISAAVMGLEEPLEDGHSFEDNARIKAEFATSATGLPSIADDSGLVVPALNGSPGIYSARWAGPDKNYQKAMLLIQKQLGHLDKKAHFTCALAIALPSGLCPTFIGHVFGKLSFPPKGQNGFGYDPIFVPDGFEETFGEMQPEKKHSISHRAAAFAQMRHALL